MRCIQEINLNYIDGRKPNCASNFIAILPKIGTPQKEKKRKKGRKGKLKVEVYTFAIFVDAIQFID